MLNTSLKITEIISCEGHLHAVLRDGVFLRVFSGVVAVILPKRLINYQIININKTMA